MSDHEPLCRYCRRTEAQHLPPSQENRPRARCPCLCWRENFIAETLHDKLARIQAGAPRPVVTVEVPLTDHHRLAVFKELVKYQYDHGQTHMDQALYAFEREIKERLGK